MAEDLTPLSSADVTAAGVRRPGPWDQAEAAAAAVAAAKAQAAAAGGQPAPAAYRQPPRQSLAWALLSTALLAAIIGYYGGPVLALAGVVGVFVHEYGHVLAMNALGCGPARIHIVPFMGGAASPARLPATEFRGVLIALAGPVFGLLAAAPFLAAARLAHNDAWNGGAAFIAVINLINLFPAPPLDGSRVLGPALARIHPMLERVVLVLIGFAGLAWALSRGSWLLVFPLVMGVFWAMSSARMRPESRPLTRLQWPLSLVLYLVATVACATVLYVAAGGAPFGDGVLHRLLPHAAPHGQGGYRI